MGLSHLRGLFFNLSTSYCIVFMSRPCILVLAFGAENIGVLVQSLVVLLGWRCKSVYVWKGGICSVLAHFRSQQEFL